LVEHKVYGKGKVIKKRYGGFELYIEFEDGILRWVRRDEVRFLVEKPLITKYKPSRLILSEEQFMAREIIEALRLGIVPQGYVEKFTFGRSKELKQIKDWLNESSEGTLVVIGEYGSGKSHLLEYMYSMALKDNWAVSIVEIGRNENPFHKPYQVYQQIVKNFKFPWNGKIYDFRHFIRRIVNDKKSPLLESHIYFRRLIQLLKTSGWSYYSPDEELVWEWFEGEYDWFKPRLYKVGTAANIYCYILNGISWSSREILGLKGLLLLFDESENISEVDYKYQFEKGRNFVMGLILLSNNIQSLLEEQINDELIGFETNLRYCGYPSNNPIRFAWKLPSHLKVVFAFTPDWKYERNMIHLEMLKEDILEIMLEKIITFYKDAYNINIDKTISKKLFSKLPKDNIRLFIKGSVEALDLIRFHPNKSVEELLK